MTAAFTSSSVAEKQYELKRSFEHTAPISYPNSTTSLFKQPCEDDGANR